VGGFFRQRVEFDPMMRKVLVLWASVGLDGSSAAGGPFDASVGRRRCRNRRSSSTCRGIHFVNEGTRKRSASGPSSGVELQPMPIILRLLCFGLGQAG